MNVSAIGAASAVQSNLAAELSSKPPAPAHAASSTPTDTVTLSGAHTAPAATGDIDHDGDSH